MNGRRDETEFTQQDLEAAGYQVPAAPPGDWRRYDEARPVPDYFDFDWFSARHPDLYHAFALSTLSLMSELRCLVDFSGQVVVDVGAGTGRSTLALAAQARQVIAVDPFASTLAFGREQARQAGCLNISHVRGSCYYLPLPSGAVDAVISAWALLDAPEALRLLKPGGWLVMMGAAPGALCGELTATLADLYPELITSVAPADWFEPGCPPQQEAIATSSWNGVSNLAPFIRRDFTCLVDYGTPQEAAAIAGRLYGPRAKRYFFDRQQATFAWRLRIEAGRVKNETQ
jgi:SAM-dependent methyltransferase